MSSTATLVHFSDVLCVWAYVAQVRMDELAHEFAGQITIEYRFTSIFGAAREKLTKRWRDTGGLGAYAAHVRSVAAGFTHAPVSPDAWALVAPHSSMPAHAYLCGVRLLEREGAAPEGALRACTWAVREAFFRDARDVSDREVLFAVGEAHGVAREAAREALDSGRAYAELALDLEQAREQDVRVSPCVLMNEGRQRLSGNVGYRAIAANVRELLERPLDTKSWC